MATIGVDVGGTKVAAGVVVDGRIRERIQVPTSADDGDALLRSVVEAVKDLRSRHDDVEAVGVGLAGFIDADRSHLIFAANLPLRGPVRERLEQDLDLRVVVENDGNAAAWGEFEYGAGRHVDTMLLVTVGTGIGGGLVLDRRLYRGAYGVAGEIGHLRVVPDGRPCTCGQRGCWEQYASGSALTRAAREAAQSRPEAAGLIHAAGGVSEVDGHAVTEAAGAGDPFALSLLEELGRDLGAGVASIAAVLDPRLVVIGGGVSAAGETLRAAVEESFQAHLTGGAHRPVAEVRLATLGNDAGLIGAADLALVD